MVAAAGGAPAVTTRMPVGASRRTSSGAFASEMNRAARDHGGDVAKAIPARRIGVDEDMAGAAIYLASRAGDYVVGDTITVDGGLVNASLGVSIDG